MMKDLGDVVSEQQKLLDDTFSAKREQGGDTPGDQFEVSPPGPPMEFGQGIDMGQFFDMMRERPSRAAIRARAAPAAKARRRKSRPNGGGSAAEGDQGQPGEHGQLAARQQQLREKLQSLIDRLRMEGAETPEQMEGAGEAMGEAKEAIGEGQLDRATQTQSLALDRLRKGAQIDGRADDGERRDAGGAGPWRQRPRSARASRPLATGPISAYR